MNLANRENASFDERGEFMAAARLEYLQDEKGVYGISIPYLAACRESTALAYILRPDRLGEGKDDPRRLIEVSGAILQTLPGHIFRKGHHIERRIATTLAEAIHARSGLGRHDQRDFRLDGQEWWADNKADQDKNRRRYHGQNRMAERIANHMIRKVLEVADQDALKLARRFPFQHRYGIYRAAATSKRAHQLIEAFPQLGVDIYCNGHNNPSLSRMVEIGTPIKYIAREGSFPMAFRRVKPGAITRAYHCREVFQERPDLIHAYLPETLPAQRRWLQAVYSAKQFGPPFVEWVARNVNEMPGRTALEIVSQVENVSDWVKASYQASIDEALAAIPQYMIDVCVDFPDFGRASRNTTPNYVTRRFSPDMSLRTVFALSDEWHEVTIDHQCVGGPGFPASWTDRTEVEGYQITPIESADDLYREGKRMRHCVGSAASEVAFGQRYFYHVEKGREPIATVELLRDGTKAKLGQVRGPCNAIVDKKIMQVFRKWVRQIKEIPAFERPRLTQVGGLDEFAIDDDIPF